MNERILIIEDEKEIAELLAVYLQNDGFRVETYLSGEEAFQNTDLDSVDLAILDIMLPGMDGFRVCQRIRETHFFPILMLTAKAEDTDKILGLTLGADDYVAKPFNPLEVLARVKTQLRRYKKYNATEETTEAQAYDIRGLSINRETHRCTLFGEEISLTPIEFSILWYLCERKGKVVSMEELFESVWGEKYLSGNNTVMAHIGRLREKLHEPARKPRFIKTVWGVGYKVDA